MWSKTWNGKTNLLLAQIVWKVGNHDLVLGWDAVGRWATLAALTGSTSSSWLLVLLWSLLGGLVGDVLERQNLLSWSIALLLMNS